MSDSEEAPGTVGAVRGPKNQLGGGLQAIVARDQDAWLRFIAEHINEILADAVKWQQHVRDEWEELQWMKDDPVDWYMDTFADARIEARKLLPAIAAMRDAIAVRNARAKPGPVHQLCASPGWPPVAVPGQPGRYLTCREAA